MQTALDESFIIQKFDVKKAIDPWIGLEHYPMLKVTQHIDSELAQLSLENYYQLNYNLWIPFTTDNYYNQSQYPIKWFERPQHGVNFRFDRNIISLKQGNK